MNGLSHVEGLTVTIVPSAGLWMGRGGNECQRDLE